MAYDNGGRRRRVEVGQRQDMKACMGGGWEEEDDGGVPSSSPSNAAVTSDPSDVIVGEKWPDAGPISLFARRCHSSVDLASSNITNYVSFLIFTSLLKYFITSYCPISRCLFCLVEIVSSTFMTEKEHLFPAFVVLV